MRTELTLEQLTALVGEASGWGANGASITFKRDDQKPFVGVRVEICGGGNTVSAGGVDHRAALIALLQNIEMHHREVMRWHESRLKRVRGILDEHDIYYVRGAP